MSKDFVELIEQIIHEKSQTICLDIPLLLRLFELVHEDLNDDAEIHYLTEALINVALEKRRPLHMADYQLVIKQYDLIKESGNAN